MTDPLAVITKAAAATTPKDVEAVRPWQSKTIWVSLLIALAPLFPPAQAVLIANPEIVSTVVGGLFAALRLITSSKVSLK